MYSVSVCVCVYIYTHTHTHTHSVYSTHTHTHTHTHITKYSIPPCAKFDKICFDLNCFIFSHFHVHMGFVIL